MIILIVFVKIYVVQLAALIGTVSIAVGCEVSSVSFDFPDVAIRMSWPTLVSATKKLTEKSG